MIPTEAAVPPERRIAPISLATLVFSLFAMSVSMSFVFAVLPPIGRDLGLTELQLSLIVSPAALVFVLANGFWGSASERLGRKPVILIAICAAALATLVFGWVIGARQSGTISVMATFLLLAGCRVVLGALAGGLMPAAQAFVADRTSSDKRTSAIAVTGAGFALGMVMGPGVAAATSGLGATAPFYIVGALATLAAVVVLLVLSEPSHERPNRAAVKGRTGFGRVWALLAVVVLTFTSYGILLQVTGFRMQDQFELSGTEAAQRAGIALMVAAAGLVATQIVIARQHLSAKHGELALVIGALVMLCGMGALAVVSAYSAQLVAMAAFGIGMGMVLPTALSLLTVVAETAGDQGRVGGWSGAAQGLGLVFGPLAGAVVYRLGQAAPYLVGFAVLLIAAVLAGLVVPRAMRLRQAQLQEQMG